MQYDLVACESCCDGTPNLLGRFMVTRELLLERELEIEIWRFFFSWKFRVAVRRVGLPT